MQREDGAEHDPSRGSNNHKHKLRGIQKYANSTVLSDVTIRYGNDEELTFKAHKVILSFKSRWFEAAFTGSFQEANQKEITLKGDNPAMVTAMLQIAYCCVVDLPGELGCTERILFLIEVYVVADKYVVKEVMEQTTTFFGIHMGSWIHIRRRKDFEGDDRSRFEDFCRIIKAIYELSNAGLGHPIVAILMHLFDELGINNGYLEQVELPLLLYAAEKVAEFGRDLFVHANSMGLNQRAHLHHLI